MMPLRRCLAALAAALVAACVEATPFISISPQAPRANSQIFVHMVPEWGSSSTIVPILYVVPLDRPATETLAVYAMQAPPETPWTRFEFGLRAGVYQLRYYASSQADLQQPADLVHTIVVTAAGPIPVIEYYNAMLDHYFATSDPDEMRGLDSGTTPGWVRTGQSFFAVDGRATLGVWPVCRLYGLPSAGIDSHFLSDDPKECADAVSRWPDKWVKEADAAFALPVDYARGCDTVEYAPLFRLYNNRSDANHRYTTSLATARQMVAAGWIAEGRQRWTDVDLPYWSCASSGWDPAH